MYYITLTRNPALDAEEWHTLVEESSDLSLTNTIPRMDPVTSEINEIRMPGTAIWTGHPAGCNFHFVLENNKIIVGAADSFVKQKASEIAISLCAEMTCSFG